MGQFDFKAAARWNSAAGKFRRSASAPMEEPVTDLDGTSGAAAIAEDPPVTEPAAECSATTEKEFQSPKASSSGCLAEMLALEGNGSPGKDDVLGRTIASTGADNDTSTTTSTGRTPSEASPTNGSTTRNDDAPQTAAEPSMPKSPKSSSRTSSAQAKEEGSPDNPKETTTRQQPKPNEPPREPPQIRAAPAPKENFRAPKTESQPSADATAAKGDNSKESSSTDATTTAAAASAAAVEAAAAFPRKKYGRGSVGKTSPAAATATATAPPAQLSPKPTTTQPSRSFGKGRKRITNGVTTIAAAAAADDDDDNHQSPVSDWNGVEDQIFVPHGKLVFVPATLVHPEDTDCPILQVRIPEYDDELSIACDRGRAAAGWRETSIPRDDFPGRKPWYQNRDRRGRLRQNFPDMQDFDHLHEAAVLYNLKCRHANQKPYTRCGDLVVSVNPFQWLPHLYHPAHQARYARHLVWKNSDTDPRRGLEPHVYEVSSLAYKGLAFDGQDQSVLITGESGSGKTETAKIIMNHIASIQRGPVVAEGGGSSEELQASASASSSAASTPDRTTRQSPLAVGEFYSPIVQRILESNPLLEAFGNAKTVRNDNSSRFGKFTRLQFDKGDPDLRRYNLRNRALCVLAGSKCEVYLLEKNRVIHHAPGERTYHIFYQLLAADNNKKSLFWKGLVDKHRGDFKYVGSTETNGIDGVSDEDKFTETLAALGNVGVRGKTLQAFFKAICVVLQLGNIVFEEDPRDSDRSVIASVEAFADLADLTGIDKSELETCFLQRTMSTRDGVLKVPRNVDAAREAADSLAKEIYSRTFLWLVRAINDATCAEINYRGSETEDFGIIGLLDIFGFESFETNTFGQLCINYANEKLQQKAVNDIFLATKAEYDFEGIPLDSVPFSDNEAVLKVIEGRTGLVSLLNEQCYRPKGDDRAFVHNALKEHRESKVILEGKGKTPQFAIVHYAGTVTYEATNFVKSNQDTLPLDLSEAAKKSTNPILSDHLENDAMMNPLPEEAKNKMNKRKKPAVLPVTGFQHFNQTDSPVPAKTLRQSRSIPVAQQEQPEEELGRSDDSLNEKSRRVPPKRQVSRDLMAETVWTKYQKQLSHLMEMLARTHSRYVRCIKPNPFKRPKTMDHKSVAEQLRCAGIAPTVALSCATFPNKLANSILRFRYQNVWDQIKFPSEASKSDTPEDRYRKDCQALLACTLERSQFVVGRTKTFFARGALEQLDANRVQELDALATTIQTRARGVVTRIRQEQIRINTPRIQRWYRIAKAHKKFRAMGKRRRFLNAKSFWNAP